MQGQRGLQRAHFAEHGHAYRWEQAADEGIDVRLSQLGRIRNIEEPTRFAVTLPAIYNVYNITLSTPTYVYILYLHQKLLLVRIPPKQVLHTTNLQLALRLIHLPVHTDVESNIKRTTLHILYVLYILYVLLPTHTRLYYTMYVLLQSDNEVHSKIFQEKQ